MAITTVGELVDVVGASRLLDSSQQDVLVRQLKPQYSDPRALARTLIERGWLTVYQLKLLAQKKASELVLGQYILLDLLGEGGMGRVYKARQRGLGRTVALKVLLKDRLTNPDAVRRFQREIRAAAQLSDPHIVHALDADQVGDQHFIVMEYVEGTDLARLVRQQGPLPASQACDYACQAALGLQHAHERGLVHRDIKPSNLLVTHNSKQVTAVRERKSGLGPRELRWGLVKILDMGLARATDSTLADFAATLTHAGAVVGTPDYISPEQARDSRTVDIRSDIYSLGCTLYYMLTGHVPFPGGTSMEKLFKHQLEEPVPVSQLRPDIPPGAARLLAELMAKKPADRPQTPLEAARLLQPLVEKARPGDATTGTMPALPPSSALEPTLSPSAPEAATPDNLDREKRTSGLGARAEVLPAPGEPRRRRPVLFGLAVFSAAAAVVFAVGLAVLNLGPGNDTGKTGTDAAKPSGKTTEPVRPTDYLQPVPVRSVLDQLDPRQIPVGERAGLPAEVAAVLGQHRFRHWGAVQSVAFSPDGSLLATAGNDRRLRIWKLTGGDQLAVFPVEGQATGHPTIAFGSSGRTVLLMQPNQGVRGWEIGSGRPVVTLPDARTEGRPLALAPDGQVVVWAGADGVTRFVDLVRREERGSLPGIITGTQFVFTPDGKTLAIWARYARPPTEIKIWDTASGKERGAVPVSPGMISMALAPDGQSIAILSSTGLRIASTATGADILKRDLSGKTHQLAFAPGGKALALAGPDQVRLHDLATGQETPIASTLGGNSTLAFTPDGSGLAALSGWDPTVRVIEVATGRDLLASEGHNGFFGMLAITPDGRTLAAGSGGWGRGMVKLWDMPSRKAGKVFGEQMLGTGLLALHPDGRTLLTRWNGGLVLWDTSSGMQNNTVSAGPGQFTYATATPDGKTAVSFNQTGDIWDGTTLAKRSTLQGMKAPVTSTLSLSADGRRLATGEYPPGVGGPGRGRVRLWDTASGKELPFKGELRATLSAVQMSPDGKAVAASCTDGTLRLWEAASGGERVNFQALAKGYGLAHVFAPTSDTLASWTIGITGPGDSQPRLWDVATGRERALLKGHADQLAAVAFTPDGKLLATGDRSGLIILWNAFTGSELRRLQFPGPAHHMIFAADGRHLITGNANGTIYVVRLAAPR